jgi:TonB family protein
MKPEAQSHTEASVITAAVMILLFLLLWFVTIRVPMPEEEEGIEVSFGSADLGGGIPQGKVEPVSEPTPAVTPPPPAAAPSDNNLMTQEDEYEVKLREEQEKQRKAQQEAIAEQRRREAEQRERERQEQEAREKALAEQRAKEQAAKDKAAQMGALFGQTDSPEGSQGDSRESASSATKGNPIGHGISGGNSWSLDGRQLKGTLPKPSADFKQEGKVVVNITVDASGKVIQARVGAGTTVSDETTKQIAVKAAYKAEFSMVDRPDKQMGSITYIFKFR